MRRFLVRFSESEASNHTPSLADFTTTTLELKFSVHTGDRSWRGMNRIARRAIMCLMLIAALPAERLKDKFLLLCRGSRI
jgi:hypothetical protein